MKSLMMRRQFRRCDALIVFWITAASAVAAGPGELKFPVLWQTNLQTFLESAATVADLSGDGRETTIVAGREELFAIEDKGRTLWRWRTKGRVMTYPAVLA